MRSEEVNPPEDVAIIRGEEDLKQLIDSMKAESVTFSSVKINLSSGCYYEDFASDMERDKVIKELEVTYNCDLSIAPMNNVLLFNKDLKKLSIIGGGEEEKGDGKREYIRMFLLLDSKLTEFSLKDSVSLYGHKCMRGNFTLTHLTATGCNIGLNGEMKAYEMLLKKGLSLTYLDLSDNLIDDEGAESIIAGLKDNYALRSINLSGNPISPAKLEEIDSLLTRNIVKGLKKAGDVTKIKIKRSSSANLLGMVGDSQTHSAIDAASAPAPSAAVPFDQPIISGRLRSNAIYYSEGLSRLERSLAAYASEDQARSNKSGSGFYQGY